jgi:hypothetical protein
LCIIFHIFQFFHHNLGPTVCIFSRFLLFLAVFQVIPCVFLIFHVCQCFSTLSVFLPVLSPYSRSYCVHLSFFKFFSVSPHIPVSTRCFSHFSSFSVFLPIPVPTVCISHFSHFSVFLAIFQVLQCLFHFPRFSVFLAIFHVLPCEFFIFHVCQFSSHIRGPSVCVTFSTFLSFLTNQILQCVFLIFHVCQCFSPYSRSYHVSFCFSFWSVFLPYSRSYSVQFSFLTFFSVSCLIPGHTMFLSHFPRYSVFSSQPWSYSVHFSFFTFFLMSVALFQVLQCVFLICQVFQFSHRITDSTMIFSFSSFVSFLTYSRSYSVCFSFSTFFNFLAIFQVLLCIFIIFHVFQYYSPHSCSYQLFFAFSFFVSFLAIF